MAVVISYMTARKVIAWHRALGFLATAPAAGHILTWAGYFYFGCRFTQDDLTFQQIVNTLWSGKGLKMTGLIP